MGILFDLSALALRPLAGGACDHLGFQAGDGTVDAVNRFLGDRFADQSQRLTKALHNANERAWRAFEVALAGESFWQRLTGLIGNHADDRAFSRQVRAFLDATPIPELANKDRFRQRCVEELRAARKAGALTRDALEPRALAAHAAGFARFGDPTALLDAEWRTVAAVATEIEGGGCAALGWLLRQRPVEGPPLLVLAVRYFFRRAVEDDPRLAQGLAFAKMERLGKAQEEGFAALAEALARQGGRLEELLEDVKEVVVKTHDAVLDVQAQLLGQGEQIRQLGDAVLKALADRNQLQKRELRPSDSFSIRSDAERQLVKQLVGRYRALPEEERNRVPALLNALGKLEVVAGDFDEAQRDFQQVATLAAEPAAKAQAHHNAYRTALERRDWDTALQELLRALRLDPRTYAPFPAGKYRPERILGAGGFGVAFLCLHTQLNAPVVVKTLAGDDLARSVDEVFAEARVLYQLDHPAIIRLLDCGYTLPTEKARPYFVMNYFEGATLEQHVAKHGPLAPDDLLPVARAVAEGLQAAHAKDVLHRDVKPANLLVRKGEAGWQVKLIDFGLALRHGPERSTANVAAQKTLAGSSIAGTLDYAAPEQMGKLQGVTVGRYSDVYGFARTCCYALFKTAQPLPKHFRTLPQSLADLLEDCLEETPFRRPADFAAVLKRLAGPPQAEVVEEILPALAVPQVVKRPVAPWHYLSGGERRGPVTEEALRALVADGRVAVTDLIWRHGMASWAPLGSVLKDAAPRRPAPPPLPAAPSKPPRRPARKGGDDWSEDAAAKPAAPPELARPVPDPAPQPPQPPAPQAAAWFYAHAGQRGGPADFEGLRKLVATGEILPTDMVWHAALPDWVAARTVPGLCPDRPAEPPPLPPLKVRGQVVLNGQWMNGSLQVRISLDGNLLGQCSLLRGCNLPFETTVGDHRLEVTSSMLLMGTKSFPYVVSFMDAGFYRITLQTKSGFFKHLGFADQVDVQKLPEPGRAEG